MSPLPDGLTTRPLRPDDVEAIVALETAAEPLDDTGQLESPEDLTAWFVNDLVDLARDTLVVTAGDELVAWASAIAPPTFRDAYGVHLEGRVHPDWRGRGIGRALMDAVFRRARERGCGHIELNTSTDDVEARALYEKLGFTNAEGSPEGPSMLYYEREL